MRRTVTATSRFSSSGSRSESFYSTESSFISRSSTIEKAYLSPFDRLPVELHAEIFARCLEPFPHLLVGNDEPPLVIARVCSAWRALVMSTPRLWSSFEIEVVDDSPSGFPPESRCAAAPRLLNTVKIWLERSRNYPLSIRLTHIPTTHIPSNLSQQLLLMLISQARRWRHVEFVLPSTTLSAVQALLPADFPTLRELRIHMKGQWNGVPFNLRSMNIPWAQLTEVDLRLDHAHLLNLDQYLALLSGASNLVSCSFNAICSLSSKEASMGTDARLYLPALEKLHLTLQDGGSSLDLTIPPATQPAPQSLFLRPSQSLTAFLHRFADCQKLTRLELDWLIDSTSVTHAEWEASNSHSSLRSILQTLSPSLHSIRLAYLPLGDEELILLLAQLSGLVDLDLRFALADHEQDPITDRLLKRLTATNPTPTPVAPQLQQSSSGSALGLSLQSLGLELSSGSGSRLARRNRSPSPGTTHTASGNASTEASSSALLPDLKCVNIHCSGEQCSQQALLELIRSRIGGATSATAQNAIRGRRKPPVLERFHFYSMSPVLRDTARYVDEWTKLGVDVLLDSVVLM